jgi:hypothetical protein
MQNQARKSSPIVVLVGTTLLTELFLGRRALLTEPIRCHFFLVIAELCVWPRSYACCC